MCGGFAFVAGSAVWYGLRWTMGVRVDAEHEVSGLDRAECGVDAYDFGPFEHAPIPAAE